MPERSTQQYTTLALVGVHKCHSTEQSRTQRYNMMQHNTGQNSTAHNKIQRSHTMQKARWKKGFESLHANADAQLVAEEIMSIGDDVTPRQIVEYAKDSETELHKCFTWDNNEAADRWRLHEARQIVCHIVIETPEAKKNEPEIRYFFKTTSDEGYKPTERIIVQDDEYSAMLIRALAELRAFQRKYRVLSDSKEMGALIALVEKMIDSIV